VLESSILLTQVVQVKDQLISQFAMVETRVNVKFILSLKMRLKRLQRLLKKQLLLKRQKKLKLVLHLQLKSNQ
jgi:hypothetical protein